LPDPQIVFFSNHLEETVMTIVLAKYISFFLRKIISGHGEVAMVLLFVCNQSFIFSTLLKTMCGQQLEFQNDCKDPFQFSLNDSFNLVPPAGQI